jgi:hypothetical protein
MGYIDREKAKFFLREEYEHPDLVADTYDRQETEDRFAIWQFPRTLTDNQWQVVRDWCNGEDYKALSDLWAVMYYLAENLDSITDREKAKLFLREEYENPDLVADTYDRQETEKWFYIWGFPITLTDNQWKIVRDWCEGEDYLSISDLHEVMYYLAENLESIEADFADYRKAKEVRDENA